MAVAGSVTKGLLSGISVSGDFGVTQNGTPNMSVNVAAGLGIIAGTNNAPVQGCYNVYNDATVNLALAASNPTNPRIDVACITIQDAYYSGATNTGLLQIITGTAASSPTVPAAPANSLVLAHIYVGANVSSITNSNINSTTGTNNPDTVAYRAPILFSNPFQSHVTQSTAQADSNGAVGFINFDTTVYDPLGAFNTGSHTWTAPTSGMYEVVAGYLSANATAGDRILWLYQNGSQWGRLGQQTSSAIGGNMLVAGTRYIRCNSGDTITFGYVTPGTTAATVSLAFAHIFRDAGW